MAADFIMTYDRTILNESSNHFILNLYYYTGMKKKKSWRFTTKLADIYPRKLVV